MTRKPRRGATVGRLAARLLFLLVLVEIGFRVEWRLRAVQAPLSAASGPAFRLATLGGSTSKSYPSILEARISQSHPDLDFVVDRIIVAGTRSPAKLRAFEAYLRVRTPNVVVAMVGLEDESFEPADRADTDATAEAAALTRATPLPPWWTLVSVKVGVDAVHQWHQQIQHGGWRSLFTPPTTPTPLAERSRPEARLADHRSPEPEPDPPAPGRPPNAAGVLAQLHARLDAIYETSRQSAEEASRQSERLGEELASCKNFVVCWASVRQWALRHETRFGDLRRSWLSRTIILPAVVTAFSTLKSRGDEDGAQRMLEAMATVFGRETILYDEAWLCASADDPEALADILARTPAGVWKTHRRLIGTLRHIAETEGLDRAVAAALAAERGHGAVLMLEVGVAIIRRQYDETAAIMRSMDDPYDGVQIVAQYQKELRRQGDSAGAEEVLAGMRASLGPSSGLYVALKAANYRRQPKRMAEALDYLSRALARADGGELSETTPDALLRLRLRVTELQAAFARCAEARRNAALARQGTTELGEGHPLRIAADKARSAVTNLCREGGRLSTSSSDTAGEGEAPVTRAVYARLHELSQELGFRLVAMQYPTWDPEELRENLPSAPAIIVVDNRPGFTETLAERPYQDVFRDFSGGAIGHLTGLGDRLLVENLLRALEENDVFPVDEP